MGRPARVKVQKKPKTEIKLPSKDRENGNNVGKMGASSKSGIYFSNLRWVKWIKKSLNQSS